VGIVGAVLMVIYDRVFKPGGLTAGSSQG